MVERRDTPSDIGEPSSFELTGLAGGEGDGVGVDTGGGGGGVEVVTGGGGGGVEVVTGGGGVEVVFGEGSGEGTFTTLGVSTGSCTTV